MTSFDALRDSITRAEKSGRTDDENDTDALIGIYRKEDFIPNPGDKK